MLLTALCETFYTTTPFKNSNIFRLSPTDVPGLEHTQSSVAVHDSVNLANIFFLLTSILNLIETCQIVSEITYKFYVLCAKNASYNSKSGLL
jgi:hypothetical protein